MKTRDLLSLVVLGAVAWFFLRPKVAKAEEISEAPLVPKPEVFTVPPKEPVFKEFPFPKPGAYIAELIPFKKEMPPKVLVEEAKEPLSLADIMEAIVERAQYG